MEFVDALGIRYQLAEAVEAPAPAKKAPLWPWIVGGLALAGGLVWMASSRSRKANPVSSEVETLVAEARNPATPFQRLMALTNHADKEVRLALFDNPNLLSTVDNGSLEPGLLEALVYEFPEEVVAYPPFVLHALVEPTWELKWVVVEVARWTEDVGLIETLLRTWGPDHWRVRKAVASNPNTPEDVLCILGAQSNEHYDEVRVSVAKNHKTPLNFLRILGNPKTESKGWVRQAVASNPNTPIDLLRDMNNPQIESTLSVRKAAKKALAARGLT